MIRSPGNMKSWSRDRRTWQAYIAAKMNASGNESAVRIRVAHQELESTHMKDLLLSFVGGFMSRGLEAARSRHSRLQFEALAS